MDAAIFWSIIIVGAVIVVSPVTYIGWIEEREKRRWRIEGR